MRESSASSALRVRNAITNRFDLSHSQYLAATRVGRDSISYGIHGERDHHGIGRIIKRIDASRGEYRLFWNRPTANL